ncbi:MAG TPA: hypothetical protein VLG25_00405 [Patescibacteria group bacterium]|nr:hypothetical protein [Patescibacteria group bacterium]
MSDLEVNKATELFALNSDGEAVVEEEMWDDLRADSDLYCEMTTEEAETAFYNWRIRRFGDATILSSKLAS